MKRILTLILLVICNYAMATNYYISTTGNDNNTGLSIAQAWKTWERISTPRWSNILRGGDTVFIRGGTYLSPHANDGISEACYWTNINGTASNPIVVMNYQGESPVLNCNNMTDANTSYFDKYMLYMNSCSYLKVVGLHFTTIKQIQDGSGVSRGINVASCNFITLDRVEVDHCGGNGIDNDNSNDITYINCDSHHNYDSRSVDHGDNGDGFNSAGPGNGSTRITYIGCRAWSNSDDGWDAIATQGTRDYKNCWAYANGYDLGNGEGFKLGNAVTTTQTILKTLNNCVAFDNADAGFNNNGDPQSAYRLWNCTALRNGAYGFEFGYGSGEVNTFRNNISYLNSGGAIRYFGANTNNTNNSWNSGYTVTNADFISLDTTGMSGARAADGSLPITSFTRLVAGSDLVNTGINVGLPFCGSAPDLGAFEYCPGATPPVANAGIDQTITLPISNVTLSGTATTSGSIVSWFWRKLTGGASAIGTQAQTTTVSGLVAGVYTFELLVTDNAGLTDTDTMQVTVNAAAATAPACNAGTTPVTITLPISTIALTGTGASTAGNTVSYAWTKFSGGAATITNAAIASTTATGLVAGSYIFRLTVTDNGNALTCVSNKSVTVNAALVIPTANAGTNIGITLPTNSVTLSGSGSGGTINSYLWTKLNGVGGTIASPTSASTNFTGLVSGTYDMELKVGNTDGNFGRDTMTVFVFPAPVAPSCSAGTTPVTITLPISTVALTGTGSSNSGNTVSYAWTLIAGSGGTITSATSASTTATGLTAGSRTYRLTVTDNGNALTCTSDKVVITNAALVIPTANAGANQSITLPTSSVSLTGSGSGGTINSYLWTKISGVGGAFSAATSANTNFTGLVAGVYQVQLRVGNTDGNFGYDTVQITVNPALILPTANAGSDVTITLPVNSAALNGVGTGTGITYLWTKLTGTGGAITNNVLTSTTATGLTAGIYTYEYKVTDNAANVARDTMQVTVLNNNVPPVVNAGLDQILYSPITTTTLTGTVTLSYGAVTSYTWTQVSGAASTIVSSSAISTSITGLTTGTYSYSLTVVTDNGFTVSDTIIVTVIDGGVISGFKWFNASIINGKTNMSWRYNGSISGTSFQVQKKSWWWFNTIGYIAAIIGQTDYQFTDNNTNKGNNTYRVKYLNNTTQNITVKKN